MKYFVRYRKENKSVYLQRKEKLRKINAKIIACKIKKRKRGVITPLGLVPSELTNLFLNVDIEL